MEMKILLASAIFLTNFASSIGRVLLGKHKEACEPINGLVRIEFPNCRVSYIELNQCIGTCLSWDGLPLNKEKAIRECKCCKPTTLKDRKIKLGCKTSNNQQVVQEYTVKEPIACGCSPCTRRRKRSKDSKALTSKTLADITF